ncbi:MAG: hypothetical protein JXB62_19475 [Pirellulales bacterium]|nr:hypothetical protein [Pirellulales bacterium]
MWRSLFLALGVSAIILGVECFAVETIQLKAREAPPPPSTPWDTAPKVGPRKMIAPPSWAPWTLVSAGAVVCLYSFTIPARVKKE